MPPIDLRSKIREVQDFPKKGINFKDIAPILEDPRYFKKTIDLLARKYRSKKIDKIVAIDARGFLIASCLAYKLGAGIVMARKKGKLPSATISCDYDLEYGKETLEMHRDSIKQKENVLIIDDVLATGGTSLAAAKLAEKAGGKIIGIAFLIELSFLKGAKKLHKYEVFSLINY